MMHIISIQRPRAPTEQLWSAASRRQSPGKNWKDGRFWFSMSSPRATPPVPYMSPCRSARSRDTSQIQHLLREPARGDLAVPLLDLDPDRAAAEVLRRDEGRAGAHVWVQHQVAGVCACADLFCHEADRLGCRVAVCVSYWESPYRRGTPAVEHRAAMPGERA